MLFAVSSLSFAFSPQATTPIKFDAPISFTGSFFNSCTGESVNLTETGDISVRGVINDNRANFSLHYNIQLNGVGQTSGATYVGHVSQNITINRSLINGAVEFNVVVNVNLNTSGGGNNLKGGIRFHLTVNANGDVTVARLDSSFGCQ